MRFRIDAKPGELHQKSDQLLKALSDIFETVNPDVSNVLEKALPKKEPGLKYPVLREIKKRTDRLYKQHIDGMLDAIGVVLERSVKKAEVPSDFELSEDLGELLYKAQTHKYIRRVPYTDSKGKRRYRYYYSESAIARDVKEQEEIKLGEKMAKIHKVDSDGSITVEIDGAVQKVTHDEWHGLLTQHYGEVFYHHVEKRARQTINAVLRHVPKNMLASLKGETDEERLADLKKRVPAVYDKLQAAFKRSGINPFRAKQIIGNVLQRKGWVPEARALVIGSVIAPDGAAIAKNYRQVISGAENLAGGKQVDIKHVAAVVELRKPRSGKTFADKVADVAKQAEKDLQKLQTLLDQAKKGGVAGDQAAALANAMSFMSESIQQAVMLKTAFPGVQDPAIDQAREKVLEAPSVIESKPRKAGSQTSVFVAGEGGQPKALRAQYKLMEAGDVIASHNPDGFRQHEKYPEGVQERAYHRDTAEQAKVMRNAQRLAPEFVANTNPDAVNGPPIVTGEGVVLGGNSRTMSMQLAYKDHPEKAAELRKYLEEHAHETGFRPEDIQAMKNPVLVRVVEPEDKSKESLSLLVRQMNESFTQAMDPRTYQVALGRRLDEKVLKNLAESMDSDETLSAFLGSNRAKLFIDALHRVGVIDSRNSNQYMSKGTNKLNADGKVLVARILAGNVLNDADLLSETGHKILESIAGSVPYMIQAKAFGEGYDITGDVSVALDAYNALQRMFEAKTISALDAKMTDQSFKGALEHLRTLPGIGENHPVLENEKARIMLEVLIRRGGPTQMAKVFREYARQAAANPENQSGLFGNKLLPEQVFKQSIQASIDKEKKEKAIEQAEKEEKERRKKAQKEQKGLFASKVREKMNLIKSGPFKYIRRWKNKKGEWEYEYAKEAGQKATEYKYAVALRPIGFATVPKGYTKTEKHEKFKHGVVVYDKPLSQKDIESYELVPILDKNQLGDRIEQVFDDMKDYLDEYLEMKDEDPKMLSQIIRQKFEQTGPGYVNDPKIVESVVMAALDEYSEHKNAGKEKSMKGQKVPVELHHVIFGESRRVEYHIVEDKGDTVQISRFADSNYGPTMPKESLKHFQNDLAGKVDLPKSDNPNIQPVIAGKAELLGKGDDGIAFKVGDKVVKVSTTVPFQPDNPGHRSPQQAIDMLRSQVETGNKLAEKVKGVQKSEFVVHGDKGFQIKDWVEIPEKFTREQLDKIQDIVIEVHKAGYAIHDDIQAGLDKDGNPVLFDIGKSGPIESKDNSWGDVRTDMDNLSRLYRDHGEAFIRRDVDESMQMWQKVENDLPGWIGKKSYGYAFRWIERAVKKRIDRAQALYKDDPKKLAEELAVIDFQREDLEFDVKRAQEKEEGKNE